MTKDIKTFYIRTYGCQMNELDSEVMTGELKKRGLTQVEDEKQADLLIFNTCSVRDLAERKVMGKLGKIGVSKQRDAVIGVTGCMAMAKKDELLKNFPHIDFVIGTNNIGNLNDVLDKIIKSKEQTILTEDICSKEIDYLAASRKSDLKAYVSIIRGCNKHCTYCIVPYTRGKEVSRNRQSIIEECKELASQGYKEITLLGQNVDSYGKDKPEWNYHFHDLLYDLDKIDGLERIRFLTSHPVDITQELIVAVKELPSVCEFIHFPMQAGSNRILRKMHRMYTIEEYRQKVEFIKNTIPNVSLGTDIIVGFPTETDEEFEETYNLMKEVEFGTAYIFAYSPRKGTPAARFKDDVPEEVKQNRLQKLLELQNSIYEKQYQELIGKKLEIFVDRKNKDGKLLRGRTRCFRKVIFPGDPCFIGSLKEIEITGYKHQTLIGK